MRALDGRMAPVVFPVALLGVLLALLPAAPAWADDPDLGNEAGSTYARVRYLDGGLTLQRTGEGEVADASINSPLAPGDVAWTGDGRAEIALADGSILSLDAGTRIDVRALADINNRFEKTNLIALEQGSLRVTTPEPDSSDKVFQIDTEGGSVYLLSGGSFRIDADGSVCTVSSFRGVAELSGDGGSVLARSGERSSVGRGRTPAEPRPFNTLRLDDFDRFCDERDSAYLKHEGQAPPEDVERDMPREVSPYVGELSVYGTWRQVPDYGWVWRPAYTGAWGPYLNGQWVWSPAGWVWVSYDPWGWAPYHYGRWDFVVDTGWIWIPGRIWSGAWVSFAVGPSYIGWCPLNYYNRPVYTDASIVNVVNVNVGRLDPRGWRFVQVGHFGSPRGGRVILRPDRLPRGTEVVVSQRLPRFEPKDLAARPEKAARLVEQVRASRPALPPARGAGDRPVPFRAFERGGEVARPAVRGKAPQGAALGTRRNQAAPQVGGGFGGSPARPRQTREPRGLPPAAPGARPQAMRPIPPQGAPRALPRDAAREQPGARGYGRPRDQVRPQPRDEGRPQRDTATGDQARPRGHVVERLFDGVRRDRPPERVVQPERPRPQAPPPESRPRPTPRREERPPKGEKHR